jgi:hypothetical protein
MPRFLKWLSIALVVLSLALGIALFAAQRWVGTQDFRVRIEAEASAALGLPLRLQSVEVALWPLPGVSLQGLSLPVKPAITVGRVDVRPNWLALLRGEPMVGALLVQDAALSQAGLDALLKAVKARSGGKAQNTPVNEPLLPPWLPHTTVLERLTWTNAQGASSTFNLRAELGSDGLPDELSASVLRGRFKDARLRLQRVASGTVADAAGWPTWELELRLGGGSSKGQIAAKLPPAGSTALALRGQFETRDVEVSALTAPERTVSGRLEASTRLLANAASAAALPDALETQTRFHVKRAVLHGIDLAQAVKSVGLNRGGQTALDTLAGQVNTRGRAIQLSNMVASSGVLSATGNVSVSPARTLAGRVNVDMAPGVIGVPLQVGGTVDAPSVMLTRGALVGAAVGTVLAPGIGTGAGASLGDKMGEGLKGLIGGKK